MFSIYKLSLILLVVLFITEKDNVEPFTVSDITNEISDCLNNQDSQGSEKCSININTMLHEMLNK